MSDDRGGFIWYELITDDVDKARDFYRAVVGWEIAAEGQAMSTGTTYRMIQRSDGGNAGGVLTMSDDMKAHGGKPVWLGYIHHPDVDAAVERIKAAGGAVHMPPMDMPGVGRMAMVADPQGAQFYVMNPTPPDPTQAMIFKWMPVLFTVMFLNFPAGLVLYWLTNNVLSIGQQYVIMRKDRAI